MQGPGAAGLPEAEGGTVCPAWSLRGARGSLTLYIHRALLCCAQVALLFRHDDVLDVLHGQVLTEGVVEQSLQLVHGQLLHVALGCGGDTVLWPQPPTPTVPTQPLRLHKPATSP